MRYLYLTACCFAVYLLSTASASAQAGVERLWTGEILFDALQDRHLDALIKLQADSIENNTLVPAGMLDLADLRLSFGLARQVERALDSSTRDQPSRNHDAYLLAWYHYRKQQPMQTLKLLDTIVGRTDGATQADLQYLRALAYIRVGKFKTAGKILDGLPLEGHNGSYIQYNLALAQLQSDEEAQARSTLASLGSMNSSDTELLALKDMANLKLGYRYLQANELEEAKASFNRIRLDGPFTNQALLGAGWTSFSMGQVKRAIVAWTLLHEKKAINGTVIEARMALPYAYSRLGAHGKAANLYARAIGLFEAETGRLDAALKAISRGELRRALLDEFDYPGDDWYVDLSRRGVPEHGFYLPLLLESDEFNRLAGTLHELAQLDHRVEQALTGIEALSEHADLKRKLSASTAPETGEEVKAIAAEIKAVLRKVSMPADPTKTTIAETDLLQASYDTFNQWRKAEARYRQQLPGYSRQLSELSHQLRRLNKQLKSAITDIGNEMESVAVDTLGQKRKQLQDYRDNALFALAESYDFATGKGQ